MADQDDGMLNKFHIFNAVNGDLEGVIIDIPCPSDGADAQVLNESWEGSNGNDRHCAFCLVSIPEDKVKTCGKCHKRAYCGRECQAKDWSKGVNSQIHQRWCGLDCGEEDVDWMVRPVEGKGIGIVAKRMIPARSRIMVDAARSIHHPGVMDLAPLNGKIENKFQRNCLSIAGEDGKTTGVNVICLRIARIHHSCDSNASAVNDGKDVSVVIVFAERDIPEGEEICIGFLDFRHFTSDEMNLNYRESLKTKWGIVCPLDCFCRDTGMIKLAEECLELIPKVYEEKNLTKAMKILKELMEKEQVLHCSLRWRVDICYLGFKIGIIRKVTFEMAQKWIDEACTILASIVHPKSAKLKLFNKYRNDMSTYLKYGTQYQCC